MSGPGEWSPRCAASRGTCNRQCNGCVPVGWLWFLAYSSAALAYLVPALVSLLLDFGIMDRGEG